MSHRASRYSKKQKVESSAGKPPVKEKFLTNALETEVPSQAPVVKFVPKTENQKKAVSLLRSGVRVLFMEGSAGSGKSMLAAWWAAQLKREKKIDKIYLIRPAVVTGKSAGLLPGTEHEKLLPYFVQTIIHLEKFLGKGYINYSLQKGDIELKSGEFLRGRSFENCVVIVEESQNFTKEDLEMVLTRLGENCTFLFTGDHKQNDLKGFSGMRHTIGMIDKMVEERPPYLSSEDIDKLRGLVGGVQFLPDDCVRDDLTKAFVKMYYHS